MPIADFVGGKLTGGIMKDVGEAIAARIGRRVRFITVPSRRVALVLSQGEADGVCYVQPYWIDGHYQWSVPLIPNGAVVLARADAPAIASAADLRAKKIGTVAGYRYPYFEDALGKDFVRDDAPSMQHNLRKLEAGRTRYALIEQATAAWEQRVAPQQKLRIDLVYETFKARCAFALHSRVPMDQLNAAIEQLLADGTVERIMARYR
jgi:polar amino acid transport system substrate-binding protein